MSAVHITVPVTMGSRRNKCTSIGSPRKKKERDTVGRTGTPNIPNHKRTSNTGSMWYKSIRNEGRVQGRKEGRVGLGKYPPRKKTSWKTGEKQRGVKNELPKG